MHSFLPHLQLSLRGPGVRAVLSKGSGVMRQQNGTETDRLERIIDSRLGMYIFGPLLPITLFESEDGAAGTVRFALYQSIL